MKIDVLCRDGSPIGITECSLYGIDGRVGVGGAELFLMTICRGWHDAGHEVIVYNDPKNPQGSVFQHLNIADFRPKDHRDILIIFRSPNPELVRNARGQRVWLSCDQFTIDDYQAFAPMVHKIVTISPFHSEYFEKTYNIKNTIPIDIPVRTWEYERTDVQKVSKRCIFTSIPDRGLMVLHAAWPRIVEQVPDASLVITSDWRLWAEWGDNAKQYRLSYAHHPNVTYLGAVNRKQLVEEQLKAELHLFSCTYEELFCLAVAESQVAGAYPITSETGALRTTNMGTIIKGNPYSPEWVDQFVEASASALKNTNQVMDEIRKYNQQQAKDRFSLDRILKEWDRLVFNG